MFKKIVNLIFIFELIILIFVCTTVSNYMSNIDIVTRDALNGNSKPAADLFKNMREDLERIPIRKFSNITVKIKEIIINEVPDFIKNIRKNYFNEGKEGNILQKK